MNDPVCHGTDGLIVGDDHQRFPLLPAGILQKLQNRFARLIVQSSGGLIAEQELGIFGKCPCNRHSLLFSPGQLGWEIAGTVSQAHLLQNRFRIQWLPADLSRQFHIFQRRQVGHQIVELKNEAHIVSSVNGQAFGIQGRYFPFIHENSAGCQSVHTA